MVESYRDSLSRNVRHLRRPLIYRESPKGEGKSAGLAHGRWPHAARDARNGRWCVGSAVSLSFTFDCFGLGFRATRFDGDLHSTFHRIFEGHLDSEQAVLVGRFGFVRFHRPT